jgi:hypothetical protein
MALCSAIITVRERDGDGVETWKLDWIEGSSFESVAKFFATEEQVPHEDVAKLLHEFEVGGAAKAGPWAAIKFVQDCSSMFKHCQAVYYRHFEHV